MKIALISETDPKNNLSWSGIPNAILRTLQTRGHHVDCIVPQRSAQLSLWENLKRRIKRPELEPGRFIENYTHWSLKELAKSTQKLLEQLETKPDFLLSIHSDPIVYLKYDTTVPIVVVGDATFPALIDYYDSFSGLSQRTIKDGIQMAKKGIMKADLTVLASEWAVQSVTQYFPDLQPHIKSIPFGANFTSSPQIETIKSIITQRNVTKEIKLLLVGVEWYRKGIDQAVALAVELNKRGVSTQLNLVGCKCPKEITLPDCVKNYGFLNKANADDWEQFQSLWLTTHFFVLPTRAECFGAVFSESAAYGLPAIATLEGGIPSAVKQGVNGYLYEHKEFVGKAADIIECLSQSPEEYKALCLSSLDFYHERLNWDVFIRELETDLTSLLA